MLSRKTNTAFSPTTLKALRAVNWIDVPDNFVHAACLHGALPASPAVTSPAALCCVENLHFLLRRITCILPSLLDSILYTHFPTKPPVPSLQRASCHKYIFPSQLHNSFPLLAIHIPQHLSPPQAPTSSFPASFIFSLPLTPFCYFVRSLPCSPSFLSRSSLPSPPPEISLLPPPRVTDPATKPDLRCSQIFPPRSSF